MNSKCEMCKYKYSWECDDGMAYPKNGCDNFKLDESILSEEEKKLLKFLNIINDYLEGD